MVIRGYNVMQGFLDDPEATAEAIDADGWLHTGDVGTLDERGNLRITDRKKDMFIIGGFNAYPAEIENMISDHPAVSQVSIVGVPDARMGEVGYAYVVLRPGQSLDADELTAWCRERMANYKVPRHVQVIDALPLNASGKVLKYELRDQRDRRTGLNPFEPASLDLIYACVLTPVRVLGSDGPGVVVVGPVDDLLGFERVHLALRVAEPLEDLDRVLADEGRRAVHETGRLGEVDEVAELAHAAEDRVLVLGDEAEPLVVAVEQHPLARGRCRSRSRWGRPRRRAHASTGSRCAS